MERADDLADMPLPLQAGFFRKFAEEADLQVGM